MCTDHSIITVYKIVSAFLLHCLHRSDCLSWFLSQLLQVLGHGDSTHQLISSRLWAVHSLHCNCVHYEFSFIPDLAHCYDRCRLATVSSRGGKYKLIQKLQFVYLSQLYILSILTDIHYGVLLAANDIHVASSYTYCF